jgi:ribosomal protein L37E
MLINCPECGKQISDSAKMCPDCGFPLWEEELEDMEQIEEKETSKSNSKNALITCPECGNEVKDKETTCPNCGFDIQNKKNTKHTKHTIWITIAVFAAAVIFVICLNNYHNSADVSKEARNLGIGMLDVLDDYLDNEITADTAVSKINNLNAKLEELEDEYEKEDSKYYSYTSDLAFETFWLRQGIQNENRGAMTKQGLINTRNELADILDVKKRK